MSIEVAILRSLFFDCVRETRRKNVIRLYDVENCYDYAAQTFSSLTNQSFDVTLPAINCCLKATKEMKFYLITGFGDYKGS